MSQDQSSGMDPEADLNMGQGPDAIPGGGGAEGPADSGAGESGMPGEHDGGADGGAGGRAEGPEDSGADEPAAPGEHDGGADGGADGGR